MRNWQWTARFLFRYVLPAIIIGIVGWRFTSVLLRPELRDASYACRVEWLVPAALLYLAAHTIWAWFWVLLLRHQGFHVSYVTGWRAYFISQYGKYIPGKVWVILIRIVMLGASRKDKTIVGVTATFETLTSMAAGALLGAILLLTMKFDVASIDGFAAINYVLAIVAIVPLGLALFHRVVVRMIRRKAGPDAQVPHLSLLLLLRGMVQGAVGYLLLGLSLWLTLQAIRPEQADFSWDDLLRMTAISSIAYVFGFVAFFLPGGFGARELALAGLLTLELTATMSLPLAEGLAVVSTLVLRLVWTVAEMVLGTLLYALIPAAARPALVPAAKELVE
jgi:glycosyltransferase 2 family protein